ncbi:MAG: hypothetical protein FJ396_14670 [Verrucomicrobia bacterium]|nr:hypothetical protein [Verrucomicrobiota bacterium]
MKHFQPQRGASPLLALLAIAGLIALLFAAVFRPEMVLFSNDGTLGTVFSQGARVLEAFTGLWKPLNWVGEVAPSAGINLSMAIFLALRGAVAFAKFYAPLSLLFLGLSAWWFCRQAGFRARTALLVGIAAALNSNPVSYACWGLAPKALTQGLALLALGLIVGAFRQMGWRSWARILLAGLTVGCCVTEGADVGAIFSLLVAAFLGALSVWGARDGSEAWWKGFMRLGLVAGCAAWLSAHSLSTLVGTQIVGVSGMEQTRENEQQRWRFASAISLPPVESLRIVVPGLFGYRMDSPDGGAYWGAVGFDGTAKGRWSGGGEYAGVLVVLVAAYASAASLRRRQSPYSEQERRMVWFWSAVAVGSLALAWGHFAPFYRIFFSIPYLSTIRIPSKFLHVMHLALWILFAFGLEALARGAIASGQETAGRFRDRLAAWRRTAAPAEVRWVQGSIAVFVIALLAALQYSGSASELRAHLRGIDFSMGPPATAEFSIGEVWKAMGFLAVSLILVTGMIIGFFSGARARIGWVSMGVLLAVDLHRANIPWVKYYDWVVRYQSNPVFDLLKEKPWEQRVSSFLDPHRQGPLVGGDAALSWTYLQKEWLENQYQYFNIQSLDISQMPRVPELETAYFGALGLMENPDKPALIGRLWQLTNTRYVLGSKDAVDQLNGMVDPARKRLRVRMPFGLALKPGITPPDASTATADLVQLLTAVPSEKGPFAVIEFTGALPRAGFYTDWQSGLDDSTMLKRLGSPEFDPEQRVLISEPVPGPTRRPSAVNGAQEDAGAAIVSYSPKRLTVKTRSSEPGILLLNDRWHPDWKVTVDGQPAPLLRANFLMRGVAVGTGEHLVEYRFEPANRSLWVSFSALATGLVLMGVLVLATRSSSTN